MLLQFPNFPHFIPPPPCTPQPSSIPCLGSCPWVVHVSSLSSLFPIPYLSLPIYFMPTNYAASSLYLFLPIPPLPLSTEIPPCDVHFSDSIPVVVICLVFFHCFSFLLGSFVDSCEFVVILLVIFFIFIFLNKSL